MTMPSDLTNLQRQIAHTTARVGQPKVASLAQAVTISTPRCSCSPSPNAPMPPCSMPCCPA